MSKGEHSKTPKQTAEAFLHLLRRKPALPNGHDVPAQLFQRRFVPLVPGDIPGDFEPPERRPGLGKPGSLAAGVAVPKTSVHENGRSAFGNEDVRLTGKRWRVESQPKTAFTEKRSDDFLRIGVDAVNARHDSAAFPGGEYVGHGMNFTSLQFIRGGSQQDVGNSSWTL